MPRKKKTPEEAAEAGTKGGPPAPKKKKRQGRKPGPEGRAERWYPDPNQTFSPEEVAAVEMDLEDLDLSEKERQAQERKLRLMQKRIPVEEYVPPLQFLLPVPWKLLARITRWPGWKLKDEQLVALVKAGAPAAKEVWPTLVTGTGGAVAVFVAALADIVDHKIDGFLAERDRKAKKGGDDATGSPGTDGGE